MGNAETGTRPSFVECQVVAPSSFNRVALLDRSADDKFSSSLFRKLSYMFSCPSNKTYHKLQFKLAAHVTLRGTLAQFSRDRQNGKPEFWLLTTQRSELSARTGP